MPKLIFLPHEEICPEGKVIEVDSGVSICDAALQNHIEIRTCLRKVLCLHNLSCLHTRG